MAPLRLEHPRDLAAWRHDGIEFSTSSNEAAKLYDLLMYQQFATTEDDKYGGLEGTIDRLSRADPDFILLRVMCLSDNFTYSSVGPKREKIKKKSLRFIRDCLNSSEITELERLHLKALEKVMNGRHRDACGIWHDLISLYPKDLLAIRQAFDYGISYGDAARMRAAMASCFTHYKPSDPYYSFILSRLAFSLEETGDFMTARKMAENALEVNPKDAWGTHTMAHIFDGTGAGREMVQFMQATVAEWRGAGMFACHNFWHTALGLVNVGDFDAALAVYSEEIFPRTKSSSCLFGLSDAASLLFRLQMEGRTVPLEQWRDLAEIGCVCRAQERRLLGYYDGVFALCFAKIAADGSDPHLSSLYKELCDEVAEYTSSKETHLEDLASVHRDVGLSVVCASQKFISGDFSASAGLLYPRRFDLVRLGGSHAQRDVFNQMLCWSLMNSQEELDWSRCRALLEERKMAKNSLGVTERLVASFEQRHPNL